MPIGIDISGHKARGMGFDVTIDPTPMLLVAQFNKLGLDIRSFREPLKRSIQQVVAPSLRKNFAARGRPEAWQELADSTYQIKSSKGFGSAADFPLVRTGRLQTIAGQLNLWKIDGLEGAATLNLPDEVFYGGIHQAGSGSDSGGVYTRKNRRTGQTSTVSFGSPGYVPQRIWALLQDEDIDGIEDVFESWLQERVRSAGFN
jgi:phage gpG-like protein